MKFEVGDYVKIIVPIIGIFEGDINNGMVQENEVEVRVPETQFGGEVTIIIPKDSIVEKLSNEEALLLKLESSGR